MNIFYFTCTIQENTRESEITDMLSTKFKDFSFKSAKVYDNKHLVIEFEASNPRKDVVYLDWSRPQNERAGIGFDNIFEK